MKKKNVRKLKLGLYEIKWKSGGSSLASVGQDSCGRKWFAPVNWICVPSFDWKPVDSVGVIRTNVGGGENA